MKMTNKEKYLAIENGYALQMGRCEYEELMTYVDLYHDVDWGVLWWRHLYGAKGTLREE